MRRPNLFVKANSCCILITNNPEVNFQKQGGVNSFYAIFVQIYIKLAGKDHNRSKHILPEEPKKEEFVYRLRRFLDKTEFFRTVKKRLFILWTLSFWVWHFQFRILTCPLLKIWVSAQKNNGIWCRSRWDGSWRAAFHLDLHYLQRCLFWSAEMKRLIDMYSTRQTKMLPVNPLWCLL